MATNERNVDRMMTVIDSASQHARKVYYLYLGFIAYCAVTVFSTTDRQLALKGDTAKLPILDISVPLEVFFVGAPILVIIFYIYFMLYLNRLNSRIEELMLLVPNFNKKKLYPWMINIIKEPEQGFISFLEKGLVGLTLWFTLPVTMVIFAWKLLKKHDEFLSYAIVSLVFASILIVTYFWNRFNSSFWNQFNSSKTFRELREVLYCTLISLVIIFGWYELMLVVPQINQGYLKWANLDLRNEILVKVPDEGNNFDGVYWGDFEGVNWNGADLTGAVLQRANLRNSNLKRANLLRVNLYESDLSGATLDYSVLKDADLRFSQLGPRNEDLFNTIKPASLSNCTISGTKFQNSNLRDTDFKDTIIDDVNFQGADLNSTKLDNALLIDVNLQASKNLKKAQLCLTATLYKTAIDESLLKIIQKDKMCSYKLTFENLLNTFLERLEEGLKKRHRNDHQLKSPESK